MRGEYTPMELKAVAARLDMTVGTRLHFTIDAVCSGVPSLLITQDGDLRCHGIVGDMLGQKDYVYNIDHITSESLSHSIGKLWENRVPVRAALQAKVGEIKRDTYKNGEFVQKVVFGSSTSFSPKSFNA
jgi:polysaccharide pyruvyl transferase WcaK-like protein